MIANAGIQAFEPLASTSEEDWNNVIDIKVKRTANTARAALPHMLSRKYGRIDAGEAWRWSCAVLAKPFKGGLQLTVSQSGQCRTDQTDRQFPRARAYRVHTS